MSNSSMRVILAAVVVLGLVSSGICQTGGWKTSPGTLKDLSSTMRKVPGWDDKYDVEEIDSLLNPKTAKLRLHKSKIVAGAFHLYIINSQRGTECFIFFQSLQAKVALQGWIGSRKVVSNSGLTAFTNKCMNSMKLGSSMLMNQADHFWPTKTGTFITKKYNEEKKEEFKEEHPYPVSGAAKHGAETVGFFEFARAN